MQIHEHKDFTKNYYLFTTFYTQYKTDLSIKNENHAKQRLKDLLSIAIEESNKGEQDFQDWLRWNYGVLQNWIASFRIDMENVNDQAISSRMDIIKDIIETVEFNNNPLCQNSAQFKASFEEYKHALDIFKKRSRNPLNLVNNTADRFISLIRSLLLTKNTALYDELKDQFAQDYEFLSNYLHQNTFQALLDKLANEWHSFSENADIVFQSEEELQELQNTRFKSVIESINLEQEMTLMQQIYKQIGDFYDQIKDALNNIKNQAFELTRMLVDPISHPIQTLKNLWYAICHPLESAKAALGWIKEHPWKTLFLTLGIVAGAAVIGLGVGIIGTALGEGSLAAIASITSTDLVVASVVGGGIGLTAVTGAIAAAGGRAAREVAIHSSQKVTDEIAKRSKYILQMDEERKVAQEAIRKLKRDRQQANIEEQREGINQNIMNPVEANAVQEVMNEVHELERNALELSFCKEDVTNNIIQMNQQKNNIQVNINGINDKNIMANEQQAIRMSQLRGRFFSDNSANKPALNNMNYSLVNEETIYEFQRKAEGLIPKLAAKHDYANLAKLTNALSEKATTELVAIVLTIEESLRDTENSINYRH